MIPIFSTDKSFIVPYRADIAAIIEHAKTITHEGQTYLAVRAGVDEARLLRNTGHACPSPIHNSYDWNGTTPWAVQRVMAGELCLNHGMFVLSDLGTGKTRSVLYAFDFLKRIGRVKRMLVCCTMSTMSRVWESEIIRYFPHLTRAVLYGSKAARLKQLLRNTDIAIINHDGLVVIHDDLMLGEFDVLCVDELAILRNAQTQRWKKMNALARQATYVWGLTGSPIPRAPTDAWAQIKLIDPTKTSKHFSPFRDAVMHRVSQFTWMPKRDAVDTVFKAMQPSVRFTRDDIMELPDFQEVDRVVPLSPEQTTVYNSLLKKMVAQYKAKEVTAANEGVLLTKLLQVAAGFVYTEDGSVAELPCEERYGALLDLFEETNQKIIVFAPFIHTVRGLHTRLKKDGFDVAMIYGDTSKSERDRVFNMFQNTSAIRALVAHPGTMAHGLTLTSANVIAWWSPTTSLEIYDQANGRINRPGQKHKMLSARFIGANVEKRVYTRLTQHARMQGVLLDLFEDESAQFV